MCHIFYKTYAAVYKTYHEKNAGWSLVLIFYPNPYYRGFLVQKVAGLGSLVPPVSPLQEGSEGF